MGSSSSESHYANWELSGDEICLRLPDGSMLIPTGDEIFRCVFEGGRRVGKYTVPEPRLSSLGRLEFSRVPVEFRLTLETLSETPLVCRILADANGKTSEIREPLTRISDHVVISGTWYPFRRGALDEIRLALKEAGVGLPGPITLGQYLALSKLAVSQPLIEDLTFNAAERLKVLSGAETEPLGFEGHLYPYQTNGYRWLKLVSSEGLGCILADEMGLGKTPQIIALLLAEKTTRPSSASLVVAPATILANWERELAKFAPSLKVCVHRGAERAGLPPELKDYDVVVTSYETAVRDLPLLRMFTWNVVVLDEAQAVKTPDTRRTLSVKRLRRRVGIAATGTPLENRLTDLWSLMDFAVPGYLGSLEAFEARYQPEALRSARSMEPLVTPLILRRRVSEVAIQLPNRIDIPQRLELTPTGAVEYDRLRSEIQTQYGEGATLVSLTKLRMYCSHPHTVEDNPTDDVIANSPKYQRLLEILEEIFSRSEKALVFTSFTSMVDILVRDIAKRTGVYVDWVDGRVPVPSRQEKVDRFSTALGPGVLVLNPRTGGTGLNITAANHVIHYNLEWNPAVEDQASARAHRLGQKKTVTVHSLFYLNTVEEVISDRLARKRALGDAAVVGTRGEEDDRQDILRALRASPVRV